jgi:formamidopyrimidine-DNA glycosylase
MTGRFEIAASEGVVRPGDFAREVKPDDKHAHVVFETEAGATVTYYDPRRFGFMDLIATDGVDRHPWFATMGPEPLGEGFDVKTLEKAFENRKQGPKTLLLDQRTVAGLGNIYVCEALHRAHISPFKPSGGIAGKRLGPLTTAIKEVLAEAVEVGGSTLKDFAAADGALGYFQHRFRVYDREGEPCPTSGCKGVIAREVQAGRSTFLCPVCQV